MNGSRIGNTVYLSCACELVSKFKNTVLINTKAKENQKGEVCLSEQNV